MQLHAFVGWKGNHTLTLHSMMHVVPGSTSATERSCSACLAYELNFCQAITESQGGESRSKAWHVQQAARSAPARRIICDEADQRHSMPIICNGWAASIIVLSDGSRQILSFLLPGDLVSTALLFEARRRYQVEAVTDVSYRVFKRGELKAILLKNPDLFDRLAKAWIEERDRADQLIVDLGRRTADVRIARLMLNLAERLGRRGMIRIGDAPAIQMDFPLRQHHIADATGLTPVHVSKVLSEFRRRGLITLSDRSLNILDPAGFRSIAQMR